MNWILLILAGLFEICWASAMKASHGFTRLGPSLLTAVAMAASVILLACSMRTIPLGTAYAVWTGIGALGAAAVGMMFFGDPVTSARILCLVLILTGVAGLKFLS